MVIFDESPCEPSDDGAHVSGFRTGDVRLIGDFRPAARVEDAAAAGGLRKWDTREGGA